MLISSIAYFIGIIAVADDSLLAMTPARPNVLLITIDSLRSDMLGAYGCSESQTPFLDRLAKQGCLFTEAVAASAWTSPSIISILTGLYPDAHGVVDRCHAISPAILDLAKAFRSHSYHVPALSYLLAIEDYRNLGFEDNPIADDMEKPGGALLRWRPAFGPWFVFYHFHGLHLPYNVESSMVRRFLDRPELEFRLEQPRFKALANRAIIINGEFSWQVEDRVLVLTLYRTKLRRFDAILAAIFSKLAAQGILRDTIIAITADHGDSLLEHGQLGHPSTNLDTMPYDELLHIPLLVIVPGDRSPRIIPQQVQSIDLYPTLLNLSGVRRWPQSQGCSLLPLMTGLSHAPTHEIAYASSSNCGHQCFDGAPTVWWLAARTPEFLLLTKDPEGNRGSQLFAFGQSLESSRLNSADLATVLDLKRSVRTTMLKCQRLARKLSAGAGADSLTEPIPNSLQLFYRGLYFQVNGGKEKALDQYYAALGHLPLEGLSSSLLQQSKTYLNSVIEQVQSESVGAAH